jgi:hypothetical protein
MRLRPAPRAGSARVPALGTAARAVPGDRVPVPAVRGDGVSYDHSNTACESCFCPEFKADANGSYRACETCRHPRSTHTRRVNMAALEDSVPAGKTDTSRAAFESLARGRQQEALYSYVLSRGGHGSTLEEASTDLGMLMQSTAGRMNDLQRAEMVVNSGHKRMNRTKRQAIVWVTP